MQWSGPSKRRWPRCGRTRTWPRLHRRPFPRYFLLLSMLLPHLLPFPTRNRLPPHRIVRLCWEQGH